jgi:hypothetical protein
MCTDTPEPLIPRKPKLLTTALRQARALALTGVQQKEFYTMLFKKPSQWDDGHHQLIRQWLDSDTNPANRTERKKLIEQLHKPGDEWSQEDLERMGSFLTQKFFKLTFVSKIGRTQLKRDPILAEDCVQEFFSRPKFRRWLKAYDPEKGGLLSPINKIITDHAKSYFLRMLIKTGIDLANSKDSGNRNDAQDGDDNPLAGLTHYRKYTPTKKNKKNNDIQKDNKDISEKLEHKENKKVSAAEVYQEADKKRNNYVVTPESECMMEEIKSAIDKFIQGLPSAQHFLFTSYSELKRDGGKADENVAALMAKQGFLDSKGKPHSPGNIRKKYGEIKEALIQHLIENRLVEEDLVI